MKNIIKKISIMMMVTLLMVSMCAPAFADGNYTQPLDTTNATLSANVFIIFNEDAVVPTRISYNPDIEYVSSDNGKTPMGEPSINEIKIDNVEVKTYDEASEYSELDGKIEEGQKFIISSLDIDFSNVEFAAPGTYRYSVSGNRDFGIENVYIDVYVENNDTNDGLKIVSISIQDGDGIKETSLIYEYKTYDLDITKIIKGSAADMNEKFSFTITMDLNSYINGENIKITTSTGETYYFEQGEYNTRWTKTIQLGHNEKITIHDLPNGASIEIREENGNYVATYQTNENGYYTMQGNSAWYHINEKDGDVIFTNTKTGIIPTGITTTTMPMAMLIIIGAMGIILIKKKKAK